MNGDGKGDLLVGCFSGFLHFVPATDGGFAAESWLKDKADKEIHAGQHYGKSGWVQNTLVEGAPDSILGLYPDLADWDGDGDLDLMIGGRRGCIALRINEGTEDKAEFSATPRYVEAGDSILQLKNHVSSDFVDVDGDGLADLVCVEHGGAMSWYPNKGDAKTPKFEDARAIANKGDESPKLYPRVSAADLNGDGKVDLLVGAKDGKSKPGIWALYQE